MCVCVHARARVCACAHIFYVDVILIICLLPLQRNVNFSYSTQHISHFSDFFVVRGAYFIVCDVFSEHPILFP